MPPIYIHLIIGMLLAEIILRKIENDPETFAERRKEKRWWFWLAGGLGGISPDLDIIPALITGQPIFTYHFIYTHTLIAMGIFFALVLITRFNPYMLTYSVAYGVHLLTDLIALMDHLNVEKAHLVGVSMGGIITQVTTILYPERIISATIANSFSFLHARFKIIYIEGNTNWCFSNKLKGGILEFPKYDERIKEIKCPVLLMGGVDDILSPPKYQEYTKSQIPHAEMSVIPDVGHMLIVENSRAFNRTVIDFLKRNSIEKVE